MGKGLPKKYAKMGFKKGWAAYRKSKGTRKRSGNPGKKKSKSRRRGNTAKKKGKRKKKSWKRGLSVGLQTVLALNAEVFAVVEGVTKGQYERIPHFWVLNRTGYNMESAEFNAYGVTRAIGHNIMSIAGPKLVRMAMANVK